MTTPPGFEIWNRAHQGAYRKGYAVGESGTPKKIASCPYGDKRKPSGRLSWSRSFIKAWWDGFEAGARVVAARKSR